MAAFGFALAAGGPAQSVLLLERSASTDRRTTFAWLAAGQALGMGVGAFAAGYLVDLARPDGLDVAFLAAGAGFLVSAGMLATLPRGPLTHQPGSPRSTTHVGRRPRRCASSCASPRCVGRPC